MSASLKDCYRHIAGDGTASKKLRERFDSDPAPATIREGDGYGIIFFDELTSVSEKEFRDILHNVKEVHGSS